MKWMLVLCGLMCGPSLWANEDADRIEELIDAEFAERAAGIQHHGGTRVNRSSATAAPASAVPEMDAAPITISREITFEQAASYAGTDVMILSKAGKKYRGRIIKVTGDKLHVLVRQHGAAQVAFPRANIAKIERH